MLTIQSSSTASTLPYGNWFTLNPSLVPSKAGQFGLVTNSKNHDIYMFGGYTGSARTNQFLVYNTTLNDWYSVSDTNRPTGIDGPAMNYDPVTNQIIVFGGKFDSTTWHSGLSIYNFSNNTWTNIVRSTQPSNRINVRMAYDSTHKVHLLYGGYDDTSSENQELWALNTSDYSWTLLSATNLPGARYQSHFTYIPSLDASLLFSGRAVPATVDGSYLYFYGNDTWKQLDPASSPASRSNGGFAYDYDNDRVYLYGGYDTSTNFYGDTWQFNPTTLNWVLVTTNTVTGRGGNRLAYSSNLHGFISFGGQTTASTSSYISETQQLVVTDNAQTTVTNTRTKTDTTTQTEKTTQTEISTVTTTVSEILSNNTQNLSLSTSFFIYTAPISLSALIAIYRNKRSSN